MGRISNAQPVTAMKPQFVLVRKLGGGAFGEVYLVRARDSKQLLAAKHQRLRSGDQIRHVRREVDILEGLRDPAIVALVDYFESRLECVILTEYLAGGELFERIADTQYSLTEAKCKGFMRQVLSGLSYIHDRGVIHFDLKPSNIVCVGRDEEDHRVKIIDFGLARRLAPGRTSLPVTVCGTPEFIAPEVWRCAGAGTAADMWSTGVIVFMLVTGGASPFYSRNKYKLARRSVRGNYDIEQFGSAVSAAAKAVVRGLLLVEPGARLTAAQCLHTPWLQDTEGQQVRRLETAAMRRWLARRRWLRAGHLVRATLRIQKLRAAAGDQQGPGFLSSLEEVWI